MIGLDTSTNGTTLMAPTDVMHDSFHSVCNAVFYFERIYLLCVIGIGIAGNSITIIIFRRTKNQQFRRTRFFLISLAASDTIYLFVLLCHWFDKVDIYNVLNRQFVCQVSVYVTYVTSFMSSAIVLAFTVQRYISIAFPFKKSHRLRSKVAFCAVLLVALLFYSFALWGYHVEPVDQGHTLAQCKARPAYETLVDQLNLVDSVLTFCLPFVGIVSLNLVIIKKLRNSDIHFIVYKAGNNQSSMQSNNLAQTEMVTMLNKRTSLKMQPTLTKRTNSLAEAVQRVTSRRVTKMLLVISSVFLVLNLPYHSYAVYLYYRLSTRPPAHYTLFEDCILTLTKQVFYTSFGCNFFLYSITGTAFRVAFRRSLTQSVRRLAIKPFTKRHVKRTDTDDQWISVRF
jgi:hypothetical protein